LVVGFAFVFGVPLGLASGYFGGKVDNLLMRLVDAFLTFPPLLLAVAVVGLLGPDLQYVTLALGIVQAPVLARMVRGSTLAVREDVYVMAARALGAGPTRIVLSHLLRNVMSPIVVQLTIVFSAAVIAEASLSFLGFGTQPPEPSWGRDMSEARRFLSDAPWMFLTPTLTIMLCVLSINFLGDGLRDALDPRAWRTRRTVDAAER
jgi:peptide/nickel transport system permease protein